MLHKSKIAAMLFLASFIFIFTNTASAHCDSVEGPVVKASQKALETGNLNYVFVWVRAEDEQEIKAMFDKVNKVRTLSPEAKELADMYFFETVVRVHRMGEGEPYTGLKPVGYHPAEGIEAADIAIEKNSVENILTHLDKKYHSKVKDLFDNLQSKKNYDVNDVTAGRKYGEAYVHFIHYVEGLFKGEDINDTHNENKH
ncbi:MAG: hypothetical protein IPH11_05050 [Ignavibacteriales bacterium]|nr:hypothetical protein [Ignavibacteriales bacterium]